MLEKKEKYFHEIDIEINHGCNRTCWYCPNDKMRRSEQGEMSEEVFNEIIFQLKRVNYRGKICFHFYNEPLLCSKLIQFVKFTKAHLPESFLEIFSNGLLLTEERFLELCQLGVDKFTITKHHGVTSIFADSFREQVLLDFKQRLKVESSDKLQLTNRGGIIEFEKTITSMPLSRPCFIPSCMLVITVKGNVLACYEDYEQKSEMGNVLEKNIFDIWNSDHYLNFREDLKKGHRHKYKLCQNCDNLKMIQ